jgi:hypothetical protein
VPAAAGVADEIAGFCWLEVNEFGPVQEYVAPGTIVAFSCSVCPTQIGPLLLATGAAVVLTVSVADEEASD